MRSLWVAALLICNQAAVAEVQGDAERGRTLAYTCTGCHGIPFYTNAYPTYYVPKLGGQNQQYLIDALKAYRNGDRKHATMQAQASTLTDQDIVDITAYLVRAGGKQ